MILFGLSLVALVVLVAFVASAVAVVAMALFAPEGWEDETGYHDGPDPRWRR